MQDILCVFCCLFVDILKVFWCGQLQVVRVMTLLLWSITWFICAEYALSFFCIEFIRLLCQLALLCYQLEFHNLIDKKSIISIDPAYLCVRKVPITYFDNYNYHLPFLSHTHTHVKYTFLYSCDSQVEKDCFAIECSTSRISGSMYVPLPWQAYIR